MVHREQRDEMAGTPARTGYPFPPITEAVIEFRFATEVSERDLQAFSSALAAEYPNESLTLNKGFRLNIEENTADVVEETKIIRRSNTDEDQILLIGPKTFSVSQLAVYPGWEDFIGRTRRHWEELKSRLGYRKVEQIGVRYINRLDLPRDADGMVHHERYLNIYPAMPAEFPDHGPYAMQVLLPLHEIKAEVRINSGSDSSPLPDCIAFVLDFDIVRQLELPQKDDEIFSYLDQARDVKNRLFEACVRPEAKELFLADRRLH